MLRDFYLALAPLSFTLLGLWLLVVQTRHAEWRDSPLHRRRAYAVWLQFALPGLMALLSLIDPSSQALWRVSFAGVATVGVIMLLVLRSDDRSRAGNATYAIVIAIYLAIVLVACAPAIINTFGSSFTALHTEAVLLSLLIFAGVNVAWFLLFEDTPDRSRDVRRMG